MEPIDNIVVYILLTFISFTISENWILFQRNDSLDGKLCEDVDTAFSKIQIYDISACLLDCVNHSSCKSVFHTQTNGDCKGCTVRFSTSNQPTALMDGSNYYQKKADCLSDWSVFENSCYFITAEKTNFLNGLEKCRSFDARPVIIDGENENNFVKELIRSTTDRNNDTGFYTGFTDSITDGIWVEYGTDNQMTFQDWMTDEPNGGTNEYCLAFIFFLVDLKWADIPCDWDLRMICEIDA